MPVSWLYIIHISVINLIKFLRVQIPDTNLNLGSKLLHFQMTQKSHTVHYIDLIDKGFVRGG